MNNSYNFLCRDQRIEVDSESINNLTMPELLSMAESVAAATAKYADKPATTRSVRLAQWANHWHILVTSTVNQRLLEQQQQLISNIDSLSHSIDDLSSRLHSLNHSRSVVDALW